MNLPAPASRHGNGAPAFQAAAPDESLSTATVQALVAQACPPERFHGRRVLLIVPDSTRTAPVGLMFRTLHDHLAPLTSAFDVLIALGTHQPMSEAAIGTRLEISPQERASRFARVRFHNHAWDQPAMLRTVGSIPASDIAELTQGRFAIDVPVEVNRLLFEYDHVLIVGPVFPHEVVGFSGGNKYLFPGVSGPQILNFFHWLGAVVTAPKVIGHKDTPVRRVVDRAGALVHVPKLCFSLVVDGPRLAGLFAGSPEESWDQAADLSRERHIIVKEHPFHTILARAPEMYDEIWTAAKCMYKLEPVLADGGELIIFAPHVDRFSATHQRYIQQIGYHCLQYFLQQWDRFQHLPWGVLAHSTHVRGIGTFRNGVEQPRARVTLATRIPPDACRAVNLGYRNPDSIRIQDFTHREADGILYVPKAGEILHRLRTPPPWAA